MIRLAVVLAALRMCSDGDAVVDRDAGAPVAETDGGGLESPDAAVDAGTSAPPNAFPLDPSADGDSAGEGRDGATADLATCFDGLDNEAELGDSPNGADCDDPGCATLPSCWIGRDAECGPPVLGPSFDDCSDGSCLVGATTFGAPSPFVDGLGVALGGDASYDSGLVYEASHDLRTDALTLTATLGLPEDCDGCLESAAFGVTANATYGTTDHVEPIAALSLSGARSEVALLVGSTTVARFPASVGPWTLELSPLGTVRVLEGGTVRHEGARFARSDAAHVVLYGHTRNPSATPIPSARVVTLSTQSERCDMPSAWSTPESLRFERGSDAWSVDDPRSPSVALDPEGVPTLVFLANGALHAAKAPDPNAPSRFVPTADNGLDGPSLADDLVDVELLAAPDGFFVYGHEGSREGPVVRRPLSADARTLGSSEVVSLGGSARVEGFGVAQVGSRVFLVAAREGSLVTYRSEDGASFVSGVTLPTQPLDADALGAPDLFVVRATYRVSVPVRRGTRWRTALFASDDFVHWRLVDPESASSLDGEERLGLRDGDVSIAAGRESFVYEAYDGVQSRLRRRTRLVP